MKKSVSELLVEALEKQKSEVPPKDPPANEKMQLERKTQTEN